MIKKLADLAAPRMYDDNKLGSTQLAVIWAAMLLGLVVSASVEVDVEAQYWLAGSMIAFLAFARRKCEHGVLRIIYLAIIVFLSIRYIAWRTSDTLLFDFHDLESIMSTVWMMLLYLAELYGIALGLLGVFVCIEPISRRIVMPSAEQSKWPTVDVFITTYNEPQTMIRVTLQAAAAIHYPKDKLNIYLLDDGGTRTKLQDEDPVKAQQALTRSRELQLLCEELSVHYLTRDNNHEYKAGNVNAALKRTKGELVVILDTDHVPTTDFLEKTIGQFERDPKLFLVQTPHFFINPDPIEKNLDVFTKIPSENEVFYRLMQRGLDYWNGTLFCGSAAIMRRKCLEETGGFSTMTVTEDAETGLELHSRGYNSAYIGLPLISGLAPENLAAYVTQRRRWATGMVQLLRMKNPLFKKGLTVSQRLCYLASCLFWLFPFTRIVFLLAPSMYLMFGLHIYHANLDEILAYTLPHYWASVRLSNFLFRRVRWPFVAMLHETLQSFFSFSVVLQTLFRPSVQPFAVTPKGTHLNRSFVSPLVTPFYILFFLLLSAYFFGIWRYLAVPEERPLVLMVTFWHTIAFMILVAALGVMVELRQRRAAPRVATNHVATLIVDGEEAAGRITNLSIKGGSFTLLKRLVRKLDYGDVIQLKVSNIGLGQFSVLHATVRSLYRNNDNLVAGFEFLPGDTREYAAIVTMVHGDSGRWIKYWRERRHPVGSVRGLLLLTWWGLSHSKSHLIYLFDQLITRLNHLIWGLLRKLEKFFSKLMPGYEQSEASIVS